MAFKADSTTTPTIVNSSVGRTREYLTGAEVEGLMATARKSSRYGHRDATMILISYRHGLRASEVCDLQWHQVELNTGRLHVRRSKRGTPSVHPIQGDEIRALRRLQREQPPGPHVLTTSSDSVRTEMLPQRIGPVSLELAPDKTIKTTGYNGSVPGPVLRLRGGRPLNIRVINDAGYPDLVHWHGL
jgi:integrase